MNVFVTNNVIDLRKTRFSFIASMTKVGSSRKNANSLWRKLITDDYKIKIKGKLITTSSLETYLKLQVAFYMTSLNHYQQIMNPSIIVSRQTAEYLRSIDPEKKYFR